jgi:hypothetical protein
MSKLQLHLIQMSENMRAFYLTHFMESMSKASKRPNMNVRIQEEFAFTQWNLQECDLHKTVRRRSKIHNAGWIGASHETGMWNESDGITGSIPCLQRMLPWNKHLGRWISWTHTWKSHLNILECVCGISVFKRYQIILIYSIKWGTPVYDVLCGSTWKCHTYVV